MYVRYVFFCRSRPPRALPGRRQLGLHVRTVAMRSVLGTGPHGGGGGGGAAGALRQEFRAAVEASPCVLHLRGIASLAGETKGWDGVNWLLGPPCFCCFKCSKATKIPRPACTNVFVACSPKD